MRLQAEPIRSLSRSRLALVLAIPFFAAGCSGESSRFGEGAFSNPFRSSSAPSNSAPETTGSISQRPAPAPSQIESRPLPQASYQQQPPYQPQPQYQQQQYQQQPPYQPAPQARYQSSYQPSSVPPPTRPATSTTTAMRPISRRARRRRIIPARFALSRRRSRRLVRVRRRRPIRPTGNGKAAPPSASGRARRSIHCPTAMAFPPPRSRSRTICSRMRRSIRGSGSSFRNTITRHRPLRPHRRLRPTRRRLRRPRPAPPSTPRAIAGAGPGRAKPGAHRQAGRNPDRALAPLQQADR